jgi:hypothetical protein
MTERKIMSDLIIDALEYSYIPYDNPYENSQSTQDKICALIYEITKFLEWAEPIENNFKHRWCGRNIQEDIKNAKQLISEIQNNKFNESTLSIILKSLLIMKDRWLWCNHINFKRNQIKKEEILNLTPITLEERELTKDLSKSDMDTQIILTRTKQGKEKQVKTNEKLNNNRIKGLNKRSAPKIITYKLWWCNESVKVKNISTLKRFLKTNEFKKYLKLHTKSIKYEIPTNKTLYRWISEFRNPNSM